MINVICPGANVALFRSDKLSIMFTIIFAFAMIISFIYSHKLRSLKESFVELGYAVCSIGILFANDWITMIVLWEMMAVASWLIITESKTPQSSKAGFRYLVIHMFGGNMLLAGIIIKLTQGLYTVECLTDGPRDVAFWLILIGVGVNSAMPPLNSWISDAYPEATLGGTVFMASYTTKVGMYFLIRLFAGTQFLLYFGVFMALYGACMAMMENDLRRLFCYHIVSQLGYIVSALAIGNEMGIDGAAAHTFNNILYKGVLLMCAGAVLYTTGKRKITDLGGFYKKEPLVAVCFLIASLSIAGFPFLNGFASKSLVMGAVEEAGVHWAQICLMIASVGTLLSIPLKVNYFVFFGSALKDENGKSLVVETEKKVPVTMKIAIVFGAAACVITGFFPNLVYNLTQFGTDGNPFTVHHVLEYIELFLGGAIAFWLYRKKMKPHIAQTLDFDWIYRVPIALLIRGLSKLTFNVHNAIGTAVGKTVAVGNTWLHDLKKFIRALGIRTFSKNKGIEDDDVLTNAAGSLVAINMGIGVLIIVVALIFK